MKAMTVSESQEVDKTLDPEEWVDAYGDHFFRYARSRLRDEGAAEEVVQETFLAGIRYLDRYEGRGSQRAWLMAILRRKVIDHVRARNKLEQSWAGENDPTALLFDENGRWKAGVLPQIGPAEQIESGELWKVVEGCLERLPRGQADVFVLSVMEEMDSQQI